MMSFVILIHFTVVVVIGAILGNILPLDEGLCLMSVEFYKAALPSSGQFANKHNVKQLLCIFV